MVHTQVNKNNKSHLIQCVIVVHWWWRLRYQRLSTIHRHVNNYSVSAFYTWRVLYKTWITSQHTNATRKPSWRKDYARQRHHSKMAASYHLGFYRTGNCAIRSADAENLTLEANITSIGKPVAKLWPFLYIQDGRHPPCWILWNRK